jgi:hypothetical protein
MSRILAVVNRSTAPLSMPERGAPYAIVKANRPFIFSLLGPSVERSKRLALKEAWEAVPFRGDSYSDNSCGAHRRAIEPKWRSDPEAPTKMSTRRFRRPHPACGSHVTGHRQ